MHTAKGASGARVDGPLGLTQCWHLKRPTAASHAMISSTVCLPAGQRLALAWQAPRACMACTRLLSPAAYAAHGASTRHDVMPECAQRPVRAAMYGSLPVPVPACVSLCELCGMLWLVWRASHGPAAHQTPCICCCTAVLYRRAVPPGPLPASWGRAQSLETLDVRGAPGIVSPLPPEWGLP